MDDVRAVLDAVGSRAGGAVRLLGGRPDERAVRRDLSGADDARWSLYGDVREAGLEPRLPVGADAGERATRSSSCSSATGASRMDLDQLAPSEGDAFKQRLATLLPAQRQPRRRRSR